MADQAREYRLIPEYTEAFFKRAMEVLGGKWQPKTVREYPQGSFLSVDSVPFALRQIGEEDVFKKRHGILLRRYPLTTFDKDASMRVPQAEFVTFGNPLFEAILQWVERNLDISLTQGAVFTDPDGRMKGILLFYQGEIRDGQGEIAGTRLFALFDDHFSGEVRPVNPAILWDLLEGFPPTGKSSSNLNQEEKTDLEALKRQAWSVLLPGLEEYRQSLLKERERQAEIKQKYGVISLDRLILKLDGDLISLYDRRDRGEAVDLPIRNKEEQKAHYEQALAGLQQNLSRERNLTLSTPRFLGAVRILPATVPESMQSDADIEDIGMNVAMQYERDQERTPEDVASKNLGFDIRSIGKTDQKRYIEVKARAGVGPVSLTQNEWFKAQRFGDDYYLYVVLKSASQPELYRIQNPAAVLQPDEQMEVRYLVSVGEILTKGTSA